MRRFLAILFCVPLFAATVPNRYIVELSREPVGVHFGKGRPLLRGAEVEQYREQIRTEQAAAQSAIEHAGGRILGALQNVRNALLVEMPDAQAAQLAGMPEVLRIHPVRLFHLTLDHALPLHHVPDAWAQVGYGNAGAGLQIALIDTGIELTHPGFADAAFTAPPGFPIADTPSDLAFTNNKVIVARSYASLFLATDPDPSARDHVGHGTATAMAAAGVTNTAPLATITGVAPQAYIGVYKVFGTPGVNDSAPEDAILSAIEDAVNDGMNVINLSLGEAVAGDLSSDPLVQAVETASALGILVVASAGNIGPNPGTVETPASAPHAIAAAASNNDRMFAGSVQTPGTAIAALSGDGINSFLPIGGSLIDVSTLDGSGLACGVLPSNSLSQSIALIFRGTCTFETKLDNALAAGAGAAVVYDNIANESLVLMAEGDAALPAVMVANQDGLNLKQQTVAGLTVTVQFYAPIYVNPQSLAAFSSAGPNLDYSIKPDLVAVGENFYTAAETFDAAGELYNPSGYVITQGTSFSAPLISGAAAVLMAARPGLTTDEYRSLLVDSADTAYATPGNVAWVQQSGGGFLNLLSALNATAAASPVSISFGVAGGIANLQQILTLTNTGAVTDTFQVSASASNSGAPVPQFLTTSVQLDPGASAALPVAFGADGLFPGQYEGLITIQGANATVATNVPYWFGVPSAQAVYITVLEQTSEAAAGSSLGEAVVFRVTDAVGLPVTSIAPTISAIAGGGAALGVGSLGSAYPNDYFANVRLGKQAGANQFRIQAGGTSLTVTITGQ